MTNSETSLVKLPIRVRKVAIQQCGRSFAKYQARLKFEDDLQGNARENEGSEETYGKIEEVDDNYLKSLDPKNWKDQDHYAVLGLKQLRYKATSDDIKRAYRKIVLKHHPDKRRAKIGGTEEKDDYFSCITKAYEILGNPKSKRSYDSVDPEVDDSLPTTSEINKNFFATFDKYFKINARWSEKRKVPCIGDENSSRKDVEDFYEFWYNFQSWREFSYLDEEDKEKGQDRDERRWIEKQNKALRNKRKKEEMARIRALVDLAYNNDPRITKFKEEEKQKKLAAKKAKMNAIQAQKAEEERILREALLARERAEKEEQKRIEKIRIEKEQEKKALKKERKILRDRAKNENYFTVDDKEKLKHLEGVEKICEVMKLNELQEFNKTLQNGGRKEFLDGLAKVEERLEYERKMLLTKSQSKANECTETIPINKNALWSDENIQLLIKAVNLFPAGTTQRWEAVASFMNQHTQVKDINFKVKDVLNKAKDLQSSNFAKNILKNSSNKSAPTNGTNDSVESKPQSISESSKAKDEIKAWTKEEQILLEQAMKTYPISTPDRWDRIAECIPNRTKKDCIKRVKEIVVLVNAKKEAQNSCK